MNSIRAQIKSMLKVEPRAGGFRATLSVAKDLSILPDHFPGAPILPGMCLVQAVLLAAAMIAGVDDLRLVVLKNAKLVGPIFPGEQVIIDADTTTAPDGQITIKAKVFGDEKRRAEISLIARADSVRSDPARPDSAREEMPA
jgi:3-hydroxymyristoyl/3-hydroxydecanoyl-(acyl carrier protein) dehydratase